MNTHENYSRRGMKEGDPGNINPNEVNKSTPGKAISETERLQRKESAIGINQSLKAPAEDLDFQGSQIDEGTKAIQDENHDSMRQTVAKQFDTDDFNRVDERDQNDSTQDWDAEKSRTGREK